MPVMPAGDRNELVDTLRAWLQCASAGVQCTNDVAPKMIALIKAPSDKPEAIDG